MGSPPSVSGAAMWTDKVVGVDDVTSKNVGRLGGTSGIVHKVLKSENWKKDFRKVLNAFLIKVDLTTIRRQSLASIFKYKRDLP